MTSDRPDGAEGPGSDRPSSDRPRSDNPGSDRARSDNPGSDEPAMPELRRFRFTDETRPGRPDRPTVPAEVARDPVSPPITDEPELSDTFDVDELDDPALTSTPHPLPDEPAPAATPPPFGTPRPSTGPMTPFPSAAPPGGWPPPPHTALFPSPRAPTPPGGGRRRTVLIAVVAAIVVVAVVAVVLIVRPFASDDTAAQRSAPADQGTTAAGAPSVAGTPTPPGTRSSTPAGDAGVSTSWAAAVCGTLSDYQTAADKIGVSAESAAEDPSGAGVATLADLRSQAATLLGTLHASLSQGSGSNAAVEKFRGNLSAAALGAQESMGPQSGSPTTGSPQVAKDLILTALDTPGQTFQGLYQQSSGQVRADIDAASGCATVKGR